jgi:hypothetical protein
MKLWKEGDRSRGVCERCKRLVTTQFERRAVRLECPEVVVPDVLVAVCVSCGEPVAVPHQSSLRLQESRRQEVPRHEVRVPPILNDALRLIAGVYSARPEEFEPALIRYYLHKLARDPETARRIKACAGSPLARGRNLGRISFRLETSAWKAAWRVAQGVGFKNRADVVRGVIVAAAVDSGVAQPDGEEPSREFRKAIEAIALATPEAVPGPHRAMHLQPPPKASTSERRRKHTSNSAS